jgi:signal transduction histidine kinase
MKAPLPENEDSRLRALYELSILDTPAEQSYDDIAQLAMMVCQVPIAVVSLVDKDRQWFKSCLGLNATETHRDIAFCAHAILTPLDVLEVEDATQDYRFADNPLVTGEPGIRFYAGAPLLTQSGLVLGTLCVIDHQPRKLSNVQKSSLMLLANQVVKLLELRETHQLKNEFVSTVSHELRTPLTSISAALRMVLGGMLGEVPAKINEILTVAAKNSQRLTLLINDLLDMEKLLAGKMVFDLKPSKVLPLLEQAVSENKAYADQFSVNYKINGSENDQWILIDGQRMQQVLANFLSNAAKFSKANSTVDINLTCNNGYLCIGVRDYGQGISPDFQKRIFQKFAQADSTDSRKRGGTGLGLAISKELVERMGGKIGFTSEINQGSNFYAEFPLIKSLIEKQE